MSTAHVDQNSFNKGGMITFTLSMIVTFAMMIYVVFFSGGVDLKEIKAPAAKPGAEQPAAPAAAPAEPAAKEPAHSSSNSTSPWISTAQAIERGHQIFKDNCSSCHGDQGLGDGPMAKNLSPKPRNLVEGSWKKGGTRLGLYDVVSNGLEGSAMVSYSHLASQDRWAVVHFIRSITHNQVADNDSEVAAKAATLN